MPQTTISLSSRILFKEEYNDGSQTDWQDYARVGSFESHPVAAIIRIDLQGELSTTIHGRLNLDGNAFIRLEVSDHNYHGSFQFCALNIENNTITEVDDLTVINGFIYLPISDMYENNAVFTCALYPNNTVYHEFFHIDYNHAELVTNSIISVSTYPIRVIGDHGNNVVEQYVGDYLSAYVEIDISSSKTIKALLQSSNIVSINIGQTNVSISGYIFYCGVLYQGANEIITKTITSFNVIVPTLTRYYGDETSSFNVLNVYFPHDVLHNFDNPNYKAPTILYVHGGSWQSNPLAPFTPNSIATIDPAFEGANGRYLSELLSRGFIVVSMEYKGIRFDGSQVNVGGNCSTMLIDIDNAISYLNSNANNLHIDNSKLCLWGYSAGGHLALMYSYTVNTDNLVKLVVSEAGPTYFDLQNTDAFVKAMRGGASFNGVSPINQYSYSSDSVFTLLIYSHYDNIVFYNHGLSLQSEINNANLCKLIAVNCEHSGYTYLIDDTNGELSNVLDWYKLL